MVPISEMSYVSNQSASSNSRHDLTIRIALALMVCAHTVIFCISLIYLSDRHENIHVNYDPGIVTGAALLLGAFAVTTLFFWLANFSFGYFIAYYSYVMLAGYLWINYFSDYNYNHRLAGFSAVACAFAFFFPAVFFKSPIRQVLLMAPRIFDRVLLAILALSFAIIVIGASYNLRIVGLGNFSEFRSELFQAAVRNKLQFPAGVRYLIGVTTSALLPFTFAYYFVRKQYLLASSALLLLLIFFPITMTKLSLFDPVWLLVIALLAQIFDCRIVVVLSLLVPMVLGLIALNLFGQLGGYYFDLVNFRMVAVPSNAMNVYNDFFAQHELTRFCQVAVLKPFVACAYSDQLGVVIERAYNFGNYNASLFATEGIASVGMLLAPFSIFACGLVIALGNKLSAGLPPRLIIISSATLAQLLLNVPLSTALLTHGTTFLFLLWYLVPRTAFEPSRC